MPSLRSSKQLQEIYDREEFSVGSALYTDCFREAFAHARNDDGYRHGSPAHRHAMLRSAIQAIMEHCILLLDKAGGNRSDNMPLIEASIAAVLRQEIDSVTRWFRACEQLAEHENRKARIAVAFNNTRIPRKRLDAKPAKLKLLWGADKRKERRLMSATRISAFRGDDASRPTIDGVK